MERLVQWLDDFEDLAYAVVLSGETIRRLLKAAFFAFAALALQAASILLALASPPAAVAGGSLLLVTILYRGAVYHDINGANPDRQSLAT
jgi:cation transport ATPase